MPSIINSDSGAVTGSAGLKFAGSDDGILEIQNDGQTSLVISNQYIKLPSGNTASRPVTATVGMMRFNNESNVFEAYTASGWANVSRPPAVGDVIEYLVVAGGGGGASYGGGGGGGLRTGSVDLWVAGNTYTVTVGAGGSGGSGFAPSGTNGGNGTSSVFFTITSAGGGGAGTEGFAGNPGGSGGGAGAFYPVVKTGGTGNSPPVTPPQGFPGGGPASDDYTGGGGGGAGSAGNAGSSVSGGNGGNGATSSITGVGIAYAGGGGGGAYPGPATVGQGGPGGGGPGGKQPQNGTAGTTNRGGGGGGGGWYARTGGTGGSGLVILKYPSSLTISNPGGGLTSVTDSSNVAGYKITTFTAGTGSIQWS